MVVYRRRLKSILRSSTTSSRHAAAAIAGMTALPIARSRSTRLGGPSATRRTGDSTCQSDPTGLHPSQSPWASCPSVCCSRSNTQKLRSPLRPPPSTSESNVQLPEDPLEPFFRRVFCLLMLLRLLGPSPKLRPKHSESATTESSNPSCASLVPLSPLLRHDCCHRSTRSGWAAAMKIRRRR